MSEKQWKPRRKSHIFGVYLRENVQKSLVERHDGGDDKTLRTDSREK